LTPPSEQETGNRTDASGNHRNLKATDSGKRQANGTPTNDYHAVVEGYEVSTEVA